MSISTAQARLSSSVRLLLQLRLLLTAIALLFLPQERLGSGIILVACAFALLTWLSSRYWDRLVPYLFRFPLLVSGDAFVASSVLAVDGPSGPFFMATVLTTGISGVLFKWRPLIAIAAFQIICYYAAMFSYAGLNDSIAPLLTFQVLFVQPALYPIAGYMGSRLRTIFSDLAAEQEARQQAERATAAAEERARLARDMHDSVTKTLRGTAMAAQALPLWVRRDPERADNEAARIAKAAQTAADEARDLVSDLRTNRSENELATEVSESVNSWSEETGVLAEVSVPSLTETPVRLLVTAKQETLAILNEALANIDRHAGAGSVEVALRAEDDGYAVLRITDDGAGFGPFTWDSTSHSIRDLPEPTGHYGLLGMWERAKHAGGFLRIESTPGEGTHTTVRVPMAASTTTSAAPNADAVETA